jgi:hypothetical protein
MIPRDFRMRQLITSYVVISKKLIFFRSELGELKHLSNQRKRKQIVIPLVAASERGLPNCRKIVRRPRKLFDRKIDWKLKPKKVRVLYSKSIIFHIKYYETREIL